MVGRMNTIKLVLVALLERERNRFPSSGMSPSSGVFSSVRRSFSSISPPSATISPSATETLVLISRLLMISSLDVRLTGPATELTSWRSTMVMLPPALICGRTSSWMPTFWRWMVRNALSKLFDKASPVVIGMSCPTNIRAGWLSSVITEGVDSTFEAVSAFTAFSTAEKMASEPRLPPMPKLPPFAPAMEASADSRSACVVGLSLPSSFSASTAPVMDSRLGAALL